MLQIMKNEPSLLQSISSDVTCRRWNHTTQNSDVADILT
jgi:hypothetical protein